MVTGAEAIQMLYDKGADVLYISLGAPRPAYAVEDGELEGLHYRYSLADDTLFGVTIVWYSRQDKGALKKKLPFTVELP